jgi:hypothetical protein
LLIPRSRRADVLRGRTIVGALRPFVRRAELHERVRLVERQELALANLADERLPSEGRRPDERTEGRLSRLPPLDDVCREIFRVTGEVEATDGRPRLVESGEGSSLLRCCHVSVRLT